jgi:hypothetical protein
LNHKKAASVALRPTPVRPICENDVLRLYIPNVSNCNRPSLPLYPCWRVTSIA